MPPSLLRGRPARTTYVYDDQGRVAATYTSSPWTDEDRLLILAWGEYKRTLCPGCGHPVDTAWHPDNEGFFEVAKAIVCHACTARDQYGIDDSAQMPPSHPHLVVVDTRDYETRPLPPLSDFD